MALISFWAGGIVSCYGNACGGGLQTKVLGLWFAYNNGPREICLEDRYVIDCLCGVGVRVAGFGEIWCWGLDTALRVAL